VNIVIPDGMQVKTHHIEIKKEEEDPDKAIKKMQEQ